MVLFYPYYFEGPRTRGEENDGKCQHYPSTISRTFLQSNLLVTAVLDTPKHSCIDVYLVLPRGFEPLTPALVLDISLALISLAILYFTATVFLYTNPTKGR